MSPHFTVQEFRCKDGTDYPKAWVSSRLEELCGVLEDIRTACGGRAITITSGYRSPAYNRKIGGARNSQHCEGRAADIKVAGMPAKKVHAICLELHTAGTIRLGGLGLYPSWVHVDVRPGSLRRWGGSRT
jgi:uncharacterized protein YcbK (DUF882 family)